MEHLKFENIKVSNFEGAFRGMRNPKNSWHLSDSAFGFTADSRILTEFCDEVAESYLDRQHTDFYTKVDYLQHNGIKCVNTDEEIYEYNLIGAKDMKLAQRLIRGGSEHRKFLRQIQVSVDITAPLYWWKEFDTYKVGTVANSTSTMHKLAETPITRDCFLLDEESDELHFETIVEIPTIDQKITKLDFTTSLKQDIDYIINICEKLRQKYLETKDIRYWRILIQLLPNAWVQTRTVTMSYENLLAMCSVSQRRFHKLFEWCKDFIGFARGLPYAQDLIFLDEITEDKNS
jgi:hypothetical protein